MYFIDNLFSALTNPGEWYQFPNGTLYYYPTKDDSSMNHIEAYFSDQGMGIQTAQKDNILIENIEIYYMNSHAIYNSMASNGQDCLIENSLFEDIGGYGGRFHSTKKVTLRNCIFRQIKLCDGCYSKRDDQR